jgi:isochorismate synthase/2-succinyl-5-enolpyruvyl-6-hydroxy-3-cyclohexene-1-carboxylate synthase/2-succinyl-6-hydroxy-2,4-cyclohexadiene-1-carboxylate synthase/O-succinylbenzoate synthase
LLSQAQVGTAVCVSGTAGVRGSAARSARAARDDALAQALRAGGAATFAAGWYRQRMFAPLAAMPRFTELEARRAAGRDAAALAEALAAASPGRAPDLWPLLAAAPAPTHGAQPRRLVLVAGALDAKFVAAARKMALTAGPGIAAEVHEVPACGHALHLEASEALLDILLRVLC